MIERSLGSRQAEETAVASARERRADGVQDAFKQLRPVLRDVVLYIRSIRTPAVQIVDVVYMCMAHSEVLPLCSLTKRLRSTRRRRSKLIP